MLQRADFRKRRLLDHDNLFKSIFSVMVLRAHKVNFQHSGASCSCRTDVHMQACVCAESTRAGSAHAS